MSGIIAQNSGRHTGLVKSASGGGGVWNLIETLTASASGTLDFTSGIDSTYDEYVFKFHNVHVSGSSGVGFTFQGSTDSGSSYGVTLTSTHFYLYHGESGGDNGMEYAATLDEAQSTNFLRICTVHGANNDSCASGYLHLFAPSDTTFQKHFITRAAEENNGYIQDSYVAGYFNTTSAIDAIQFKFASGNIDSGSISLFGLT